MYMDGYTLIYQYIGAKGGWGYLAKPAGYYGLRTRDLWPSTPGGSLGPGRGPVGSPGPQAGGPWGAKSAFGGLFDLVYIYHNTIYNV